jgi:hypothetical protein
VGWTSRKALIDCESDMLIVLGERLAIQKKIKMSDIHIRTTKTEK